MALRAGYLCEILALARITLRLRSGAVGHQDKCGNDQGVDILHVVPAFSFIFNCIANGALRSRKSADPLKGAMSTASYKQANDRYWRKADIG
jgi:hypothetical protein